MTQSLCHDRRRRFARWRTSCCSAHNHKASDPMMYQAYQTHSDLMWPVRTLVPAVAALSRIAEGAAGAAGASPGRRRLQGARAGRGHPPAARLADRQCHRRRRAGAGASRKPCWSRLSPPCSAFARKALPPQPKVLVVAPMSGHFATLLRDTVRTLLLDHDVHVTDWHNIRDVPLRRRPLRPRRIHPAPHRLPGGDGPGRARRGRLPALRLAPWRRRR